MRRSRCKSCGKEIIWVKTSGGKAMPCDAEPVTYREEKGGSRKIVTPNGEILSGELTDDPDRATGIGYISHFATCPDIRRR